MELAEAVYEIGRWLASKQIPTDRFCLVLSFPDMETKIDAERWILRELEPMRRVGTAIPELPIKSLMLAGIDVRLESRRDR